MQLISCWSNSQKISELIILNNHSTLEPNGPWTVHLLSNPTIPRIRWKNHEPWIFHMMTKMEHFTCRSMIISHDNLYNISYGKGRWNTSHDFFERFNSSYDLHFFKKHNVAPTQTVVAVRVSLWKCFDSTVGLRLAIL